MIRTIPKFTTLCFKLRRCFNRFRYRNLAQIPGGISIISQNCVGGVVYNFFGMQFCSPFINMYIEADDFIKLIKNLHFYLSKEPVLIDNASYPLCGLADIKLHCLHYKNYEQVLSSWRKRSARVNYGRLLIIMTDRDGFEERHFAEFSNLPYKNKMLLTSKEVQMKDVYSMPSFKDQPSIGTVSEFANVLGRKYFQEIDFGKKFQELAR